MMEPIVRALRDTRAFGLIQVARPEWTKFEARGLGPIRDEYARVGDPAFTRLHLDHVPVIDEDGLRVDYERIIADAIRLGYQSVMVDGSRLPLAENIAVSRAMAVLAHAAGIPLEAELGAVLGHEAGPLPPYDEIFASGKGFTDSAEARQFVAETGADWLSVAFGNIHGAISAAARGQKKVQARLNIAHLDRLQEVAGVPLVLHGGSGIQVQSLREAFQHGIAKINVGTTLRQAYEQARGTSEAAAQDSVYRATVQLLADELGVGGSADKLTGV
jgi:fructose-bisphosphate aldolase, class II